MQAKQCLFRIVPTLRIRTRTHGLTSTVTSANDTESFAKALRDAGFYFLSGSAASGTGANLVAFRTIVSVHIIIYRLKHEFFKRAFY